MKNLAYIEVMFRACGTGHGYMPIVIEAVTEEEFLAWAMDTKIKYAMNEKNTFAKLKSK